MEKKPTSTYTGINKQVLKSLNRPYVAEPIKDENRVNELMSIFILNLFIIQLYNLKFIIFIFEFTTSSRPYVKMDRNFI